MQQPEHPQRRPRVPPLVVMMLLVMLTLMAATVAGSRHDEYDDSDDDDRGSSGIRGSHQQRSQPYQNRRNRGATWRGASHWCSSRSSGSSSSDRDSSGLPTLPTTGGSDSALETAAVTLAKRAASWPPGCYWLGNAYDDARLAWLVENRRRARRSRSRRQRGRISSSRVRRCLCVLGGGVESGDHPLRLRLESCHRRLPFHCAKPAVPTTTTKTPGTKTAVGPAMEKKAAAAEVATTTTTTIKTPSETTTTKTYEEALDDDVPEDPDADEAVDHGKFPAFELRPDGHPKGWLPPWTELTTTAAAAAPAAAATTSLPTKTATDGGGTKTAMNGESSSSSNNNETAVDVGGGTLHRLLMGADQRSEFVTLLVLYTIVAVICVVLLGLCLVRCCRGYCGRAKIRYVRQVDADDIPRFMPSSWA